MKYETSSSGESDARAFHRARHANRDNKSEVPGSVHQVIRSPGEPLPAMTRQLMESRFAMNLSNVPVHSIRSTTLSPKLAIGGSSESHEYEAERVADKVSKSPSQVAKNDQRSNHFDFRHVRIHTDSQAAESAQAINAHAYTVGNHIVLAGNSGSQVPSQQHLLAHELTHVVQQTGPEGVGRGAVVQRFTAFDPREQEDEASLGWKHPERAEIRVADDGQMAVEDKGWGPGQTKRAWTTPEMVDQSNKILEHQGSRAKLALKPGGVTISGQAPETGNRVSLREIEPVKPGEKEKEGVLGKILLSILGAGAGVGLGLLLGGILSATGIGLALLAIAGGLLGGVGGFFAGAALDKPDNEFSLSPDCGTACRQVMGSGTEDVAVLNEPRAGGGVTEEYLSPRHYHGGNPTTPEEWSEELFRREFGAGSRSAAYGAYGSQTTSEREEFDRAHGINKFAVPEVGQGLTVSTEKDMPGFHTTSDFTWNFHYAAAVLRSGHDYVTLESAAGWGHTDWIFFMYGPESKRQTFHEFHGATRTHGSEWTTFVVQPSHVLDVEVSHDDTSLNTDSAVLKLTNGTRLRVLESRTDPDGVEWHKVRVVSGPHAGAVGTIRKADVR